MPKLKSHSSAKKRFKKTASGKFKFQQAGRRHLLAPGSGDRKRRIRRPATLNETDGELMRSLLPYS